MLLHLSGQLAKHSARRLIAPPPGDASDQLLTLAVSDGWDAVYDPTNPDARAVRDPGGGTLFVSALADGRATHPSLAQATEASQPQFVPGAFGQLDGALFDGIDDRMTSALFGAARVQPYMMVAMASASSLPAGTLAGDRKFIVDKDGALQTNRSSIFFDAPTRRFAPYAGTIDATGKGLLETLLPVVHAVVFNGATSHYYAANELMHTDFSIGAEGLESLCIGSDNIGGRLFNGVIGPVLIKGGIDLAALGRMMTLLHQLGQIPNPFPRFRQVFKSPGIGAHQGVATNGTFFWTSSQGVLAKYDMSFAQVASRNVASDNGGVQSQINGIYYHSGEHKLYVGANNWSTEPALGWIYEYNPDTLAFITAHQLAGNRWSEGAMLHAGSWWEVNASAHEIRQFDLNFGLVQAHSLPDTDPGAASLYWQGIIVLDGEFIINNHFVSQVDPVRAYTWNGSGFTHSHNNYIRPSSNCSQDMFLWGKHVWWAERLDTHAVIKTLALDLGDLVEDTAPAGLPDLILWPADSNYIDATAAPFNADPTGVSDSTAAIRAAIVEARLNNGGDSAFAAQRVYLPEGTYTVSDRILCGTTGTTGVGNDGVRLSGAGKTKTTIKLADSSTGYQSTASPKPVLEFGASGTEKNLAFGNFCEHLTIEIGANNLGAVALEGSMANMGTMSHLRLLAPSGGRHGFAMLGTAGPGYIKDVTIEGFDRAIFGDTTDVNNYVFEDITIRNCGVGVYGGRNMQFVGLTIENCPIAAQSDNLKSAFFIINGTFTGGSGGIAVSIPTRGFVYLRNVTATGYGQLVQVAGANHFVGATAIVEWSSEDYWKGATKTAWDENLATPVSMNLPIKKPPEYHTNDFTKWQKVTTFTPAGIQAAIDAANAAGREIVYIPHQTARIDMSSNVTIPTGSVKKLDFLGTAVSGTGMVIVDSANLVIVEASSDLRVQHAGSGTTVFRDIGFAKVSCAAGASGELYVDDVGPHVTIDVTAGVTCWGRQINREVQPITNVGGVLWLYGDNVERMHLATDVSVMRPVSTTSGGRTEIIGGATDPNNSPAHTIGQGAYYTADESYLSVVQAGAKRSADSGATWGTYPYAIRDTFGAGTVSLYETQAPLYAIVIPVSTAQQRSLWPLYISPQWPPP